MDRRQFLAAGAALSVATPAFAATATAIRTQWTVRTSEGFDAICFLNPLSGEPFYADYYRDEIAAFAPKLRPETLSIIQRWFKLVQDHGGLLGPQLCTVQSGGADAMLDDLIRGVREPETTLRPAYEKSPYWDAESWGYFLRLCPDLVTVFSDMQRAGFAAFRESYIAPRAAKAIPALRTRLAGVDTIAEQERLLGRRFADPSLEIILLYFSKPHGIKIQGQRFLTHIDYPQHVVIRNADHEMLHPPFDPASTEMKPVLALLASDPLLQRVVAEHDKRFGYNTIEGLCDEDTVQALEQIVNERVGVGQNPKARWTEADDGMHIFAAGLYGLLKEARYDRTGGNIQQWLAATAGNGQLAPASWRAAAAEVLGRTPDTLWPLPKS